MWIQTLCSVTHSKYRSKSNHQIETENFELGGKHFDECVYSVYVIINDNNFKIVKKEKEEKTTVDKKMQRIHGDTVLAISYSFIFYLCIALESYDDNNLGLTNEILGNYIMGLIN